jgi:hypothetical protein
MKLIGSILMFWTAFGYVLLVNSGRPKTTASAAVLLFASGPLAWLMFIPALISVIRKNRKECKQDEANSI